MNNKIIVIILIGLAALAYHSPSISSFSYDMWLYWKIIKTESSSQRAILIRSTGGRNPAFWNLKYEAIKNSPECSSFELEAIKMALEETLQASK